MADAVATMLSLARSIGCARVDPGLTDAEFSAIESVYEFRFPDDLRAFLGSGLPMGAKWPDWRGAIGDGNSDARQKLESRLYWPLHGMLFDIEHNSFWDPLWGVRPENLASAKRIATEAVKAAPLLIPIYAHRFLPAEPTAGGNPVFSVWQMDIIVYGRDLMSYLRYEYGEKDESLRAGARPIRCWTRWMDAKWEE